MPPEPISALLEKAISQSLTVAMLLVGIYYIAKLLTKTLNERITDLKDRIVHLEAAVVECNRDREALWSRLTADEGGQARFDKPHSA